MSTLKPHRVTLIPGDGIGPSICAARIENAIQTLLKEGKVLTPDLLPGSKYGTTDITKALVDLVG